MSTLREAMGWAKVNPDTDKAKQLYGFIVSGQADAKAQEEGIDLIRFGRPKLGEPSEPFVEPRQAEEDKQTFVERVKTRLAERREIIAGKLQKDIETEQLTGERKAFRIGGGVLGGVSDVIFEALSPVIDVTLKPAIEGIVKSVSEGGGLVGEFLQSEMGQKLKTQLSEKKEAVIKKMEDDPVFAAKMRDLGDLGNVGMAVLDAIGIGGSIKGVKAGVRVAKEVAIGAKEMAISGTEKGIEAARTGLGGAIRGIKQRTGEAADRLIQFFETGTFSGAPKDLPKFVDESLEKAIRPSVTGKAAAPQIAQYKQRARRAVMTIVDNKGNLQFLDEAGEAVSRLPESLQEFGEAINQTKTQIFREYNTLAKQAGEEGAKIKLGGIADELDSVSSNKVLIDNRPDVVSYAEQRAKALRARGIYTPEETEEAIKLYNATLKAFYANPTVENANRVAVDAMIANRLRNSLDETVEAITGAQYQNLKNQYGALKTIEKDVARRTVIDARKSARGLIDYTDIFSSGDIIRGVVAFDPSFIAKGAFQKGMKEFYKRWVSPDATIKRMFDALDSIGI